jgi:hypothetical protein
MTSLRHIQIALRREVITSVQAMAEYLFWESRRCALSKLRLDASLEKKKGAWNRRHFTSLTGGVQVESTFFSRRRYQEVGLRLIGTFLVACGIRQGKSNSIPSSGTRRHHQVGMAPF